MSLDRWLQDDLLTLLAEEGWQDWNKKLPDTRQLPSMDDIL